ncbi:MAG: metallophosphoesterase family protein [Candidatus Nanoarchaeia archaeon]
MRVLAFTDMHGSMKAFKAVQRKATKADIILCCGDFTIFSHDLKKILNKFEQLKKPVLIIPGNHELGEDIQEYCEGTKYLYFMDGGLFETDELLILGAEGDGFSTTDSHFKKLSRKFKKLLKKSSKRYVLMTHAPPFGTKHDLIIDEHCGNKPIRNFIEETQPLYAFCGHIHENQYSKDKIGKTVTVNPGPEGRLFKV